MVTPPPSHSYAHNRLCGHFLPSQHHQSHQTLRNQAMLEDGTRRRNTMHRSMAIGKNQVAALRFTKRSQFCMHSREIPPLLSLPLRWVNRFGCATRDHLKLVSTQPCLACGRSPSDAHSQVCTSARSDAKSVTNSPCLSRVLSLDAPGFFLRWTQRAC